MPWRKQGIIKTAWDGIRKNAHKLCDGTRKSMFKMDFRSNTARITTNQKIGRDFEEKTIKREEITSMVKEKYSIEENVWEIYTDGSKTKKGKSVGSAFIVSNEATGYRMSLDAKCNIFTEEACAIAKALEWTYRQKVDRDITIYTHSVY